MYNLILSTIVRPRDCWSFGSDNALPTEHSIVGNFEPPLVSEDRTLLPLFFPCTEYRILFPPLDQRWIISQVRCAEYAPRKLYVPTYSWSPWIDQIISDSWATYRVWDRSLHDECVELYATRTCDAVFTNLCCMMRVCSTICHYLGNLVTRVSAQTVPDSSSWSELRALTNTHILTEHEGHLEKI